MHSQGANADFWDGKIAALPPAKLRFLQQRVTEPRQVSQELPMDDQALKQCLECIRRSFGQIGRALWLISAILRRRIIIYFGAHVVRTRLSSWGSHFAAAMIGAAICSVAMLGFLQLL